jgi:pyridoxamine 5'-phosphate oxidase
MKLQTRFDTKKAATILAKFAWNFERGVTRQYKDYFGPLPMETILLTPHEIQQRIWIELGRATQDRHHAWRTPVLATIGADATPDARTVVLREVDSSLFNLRFYTDSRSTKVADLATQPRASLVFWSKRLNWQLRAQVSFTIHSSGQVVDAVWSQVKQSATAADYLSALAPGTPLSEPSPELLPNKHHLAVISAVVHEIDWLELSKGGHRRARFSSRSWEWLVP